MVHYQEESSLLPLLADVTEKVLQRGNEGLCGCAVQPICQGRWGKGREGEGRKAGETNRHTDRILERRMDTRRKQKRQGRKEAGWQIEGDMLPRMLHTQEIAGREKRPWLSGWQRSKVVGYTKLKRASWLTFPVERCE